jgi:RND family efflux transporter MFP subunit
MTIPKVFVRLLTVAVFAVTFPVYANPDDGITAITLPSADVTLSFVQPGSIAKVLIREGDEVKANQLLVKQEDAAEQAKLLQIKGESEDITQIEGSEASLAQKKVDLKRLELARKRGATTDLEVEHAQLEVRIAELSLKIAQFEHTQSELRYKESQIRINHMNMRSPLAGTIDKVEVEVGESINALLDVIRIVRIDPLWIDVHVPLSKGRTLKPGQDAKVEFPGSEKTETQAKIIYVSTVADAASSTLRARIEIANKTNRPAGEHVRVTFPSPKKPTATKTINKKVELESTIKKQRVNQ